jgi:protein SCO1/2
VSRVAIVTTLALVATAAIARADAPARLEAGLDEHPGVQVPLDLRFTATDGHAVQLGEVLGRGRPAVLVLAYARCRMLCSVVLRGVAEAVRASALRSGRDFDLVTVSIDPRETADEGRRKQDALLDKIGREGDRGAWTYLVGTPDAIRRLADVLGFRYAWDERTEQYAHPAVVFALTPDGRVAEYVRGVTFPDRELDRAIARAGASLVSAGAARDLLECFHFDPSLTRYGARIQAFFRIGAGAVMAVLFGAVIALFVWERRRGRRS